MRADKRDANEHEILAFWKATGCVWVALHPGQGADGILLHRGHLHIVEIKQPGAHLTQCEADLRKDAWICECEYEIVHNLEEAEAVLEKELT